MATTSASVASSFDYALGRWDEAERLLTEAIARGPIRHGSRAVSPLGEPAAARQPGIRAAADAGLERAFELIDDVSEAQFMGPIHTAGAERELWRHAPRLALALIERALDSLVGTDDQVETAHLCRIGAWAAADLADEGRAARTRHQRPRRRERLRAPRCGPGAGRGCGARRRAASGAGGRPSDARRRGEPPRRDRRSGRLGGRGGRMGASWSGRTLPRTPAGAKPRRRSLAAIERPRRRPCRRRSPQPRGSAPNRCAAPSKRWAVGHASARRPWSRLTMDRSPTPIRSA